MIEYFLATVFISTIYAIFALIEVQNYLDFGKKNKNAWIKQSLPTSKYHKITHYIFFPVIILIITLTFFVGSKDVTKTLKVFFTCISGYLYGNVIEDRLWFSLTNIKLSKTNVPWFKKWFNINLGKKIISLPDFYVYNLLIATVIFVTILLV